MITVITDDISYWKAKAGEAEYSAIESIKARDAAWEELADCKRQMQADIRNHPIVQALNMDNQRLSKRCAYLEEMANIYGDRIDLMQREIELNKRD